MGQEVCYLLMGDARSGTMFTVFQPRQALQLLPCNVNVNETCIPLTEYTCQSSRECVMPVLKSMGQALENKLDGRSGKTRTLGFVLTSILMLCSI